MPSERETYDELCFYTLSHVDPVFIHQHVVDAWAAQNANPQTKPIALTFALVGLYLHVEKGFNGKQVQRVHMELAKPKEPWPPFPLPDDRGSVRAADVLVAAPGPERDRAIDDWCGSVWTAFRDCRDTVRDLLQRRGILTPGA